MDTQIMTNKDTRFAGFVALSSALIMVVGAGFWIASGTDLEGAVLHGGFADYLTAAAQNRMLVAINLSCWIVGAFLIGVAGKAITDLSTQRQGLLKLAAHCYYVGAPLTIVSFFAMYALVMVVAPDTSPAALLIAETLGWFGVYADWVGTILMIGLAPALIGLAGRGDWMPRWLVVWSAVAAFGGLVSTVGIFVGSLDSWGFLVVPTGLSWLLATGVFLLRRS